MESTTRYSGTCEPSGSEACLISPSATSSNPHSATVSDIGFGLEHGASAVHADDLPGHKRRFGGCKITDHRCNFLHLGGTAHRYHADKFCCKRRVALCDGNHLRRVHRTWRNGIHSNAVARKFARHSGGQAMDTALRGVIGGMIPKSVPNGIGAEVDDPSVRMR